MTRTTWIFLGWFTALIATCGSLFFSDVMMLPPCTLCWWQRIAMYPLVFVLGTALLTDSSEAHRYGLPLSLAGMLVAIYHNLLYYHIIPESLAPCRSGVSCTTVQLEWLGFVTIPLLSLAAFALLNLCLFNVARKRPT
jgi:disulfide bond formation protein DsbB